MLTIFEAVILGIVQGVAEWLPISSEGMTSLVMINVFGKSLSEALPISIWLHTGTLLSAVVYFRDDLSGILKELPVYIRSRSLQSKDHNLISFLILSTFLTGLVGLPLILFATGMTEFSGKFATAFIGLLLIFTGLLQKTAAKRSERKNEPVLKDSAIVGITQGFAALPGVSRSGITVSTLLMRNFHANDALRLSFLMSIPAVLVAEIGMGAMGLMVIDTNSIIALFFAFLFGIITIDILIRVAKNFDFSKFCIGLGVLSILSYFF